MGIFTTGIKTMEDLLIHGLQDIYYAEQQIAKSLPKPPTAIYLRVLRRISKRSQADRGPRPGFQEAGPEPEGHAVSCNRRHHQRSGRGAGRARGQGGSRCRIVASAQAVEHYEMCRYGTLIAWAQALGHDEIVRFLTTNLNEEKAANTNSIPWPCPRASTVERPAD
jgi:hypothetical protein